MTAEHNGLDALMAAITDEPLPEEADAAFLAEHRSATADLAVLREQLEIIGHALGGDDPRTAPAPAPVRPVRPVRRRRTFRLAVGSLAAAAAAAVMAGFGWLVVQSGTGDGDDNGAAASAADEAQKEAAAGDAYFGSPRYLACAYLVAEGEVRSAKPSAADPELVRVSLDLTHVYKPEEPAPKNGDDLTYVIDRNTAPGLRPGDHVLFGVPDKGGPPDVWIVGEKEIAPERERINGSLPESRGLTCG
ncbi:hypothetical protein [Streptomyces sp. TRM68416]|uniref:hypothetical protein n=1 Tax=Streptomyces sp. TRM68416 TaxID=2758412 RepID=UPI0016618D8A|nr:hypothetical protein [Streptomyces sp. TRM68416]MBD0837705.1 hypothetical protein [Streptomyces sp. TRM68416]